jgi:hypothetical protein
MTFAQLVADLKVRIGSSPEVQDSDLKSWINEALRVFCTQDEFYWLERRQTANTVNGQDEYLLPTDHKKLIEIRIDPTDSDPCLYEYRPWQQRHGLESTQKVCSVIESILWVHPTPSADGTNNLYITYVRFPTDMTQDSDQPSDYGIANMPAVYHPALVVYAFALYQGYDEEHAEMEQLMGNPMAPRPGTFFYFVKLAKDENEARKIGVHRRMLSKQESVGYSKSNQSGAVSAVLGI